MAPQASSAAQRRCREMTAGFPPISRRTHWFVSRAFCTKWAFTADTAHPTVYHPSFWLSTPSHSDVHCRIDTCLTRCPDGVDEARPPSPRKAASDTRSVRSDPHGTAEEQQEARSTCDNPSHSEILIRRDVISASIVRIVVVFGDKRYPNATQCTVS